ncbi:MAG TPA: hypothetical protein DEB39_08400 [Planctomycetaceae bacterium]|nr:hypothetical protein [Planctomycetaceae bacterium]
MITMNSRTDEATSEKAGVHAVEFRDVCRSFGRGKDKTRAVDHLTLSIPRGSAYGLLGANGAGKTTSIRMMVAHLAPDAGTIRVLGEPPIAHDEPTRSKIAYISENMQIPHWLTLSEAAALCAPLYPRWNGSLLEPLAKRFGLAMNRRYDEASKGLRRAMCIILGLCQNAELMILDEPASGLDTLARRDFLAEILDVVCDGNRTVVFSSHILADIERIVDRVAILTSGRLIIEGELDALKENVRRITLPKGAASEILPEKQDLFKVLRTQRDEERSKWVVVDFTPEKLAAFLQKFDIADPETVEVEGLNLEELFVESVQSGDANRTER